MAKKKPAEGSIETNGAANGAAHNPNEVGLAEAAGLPHPETPIFHVTKKRAAGAGVAKAKELFVDHDWNSRQERTSRGPGDKKKTDDGQEWPDEKLEASIRQRIDAGKRPLMQSPEVVELKEGGYVVVYGNRRVAICQKIDPEMEIGFTIMATTGDVKEDDYVARVNNAQENGNRVDLRPWERAEFFFRTRAAHPDKSIAQISEDFGFNKTYVGNLIRLRTKLHPELWEQFQTSGESMQLAHLIKVCSLPMEEQVDAYNVLVEGGELDDDDDDDSGKPKKKKSKYKTWLRQVEKQIGKDEDGPTRTNQLKGMALALRCVLGEEEWQNPAVKEKRQAEAEA